MIDISVIIPCYNQAQYLHFALDSIQAQTFSHWEAIVVDDGSTDSTAAVVQAYPDPRIRYINQENQGLSAARNSGIRAAHGRYLAFLDADDEWESEFLSTCYQWLESENNLTGVYTRCRFIDPEGSFLPGVGGLALEPASFRSQLLEGGFFPVHAALIRASILDQTGLFDTGLTSVEDWDLWLRISEDQSMRGLSQPLARYRVYPGSMSTNTARMHANRIAVLTKLFGSPAATASKWPDEKRMAYGFAYRTTAIGFLGQGDVEAGWRWMEKALMVWPPLLERVDTFYELACKNQPRGFQGDVTVSDINASGNEMLVRLESFWANAPEAAMSRRNIALGNAHLALGMLYDQAGSYSEARNHLFTAIRANRNLLRDSTVPRRLAKVSLLSPRIANAVQRRRDQRQNIDHPNS